MASSEGANNVLLARLYNELCPVKTPPQVENPNVRQTIDGHPIVIFWNDGSTTKFIGKYNFNHDKGTAEVFGFEPGDESWEILQNGTDRVGFRSADFSGDDWKNDFEARYPDKNTDITKLKEFSEWVVSTNTAAATNAVLSPSVTYDGMTYTNDTAEYRLAKFKAELSEHANVDALVYYYVFTDLFLCIDQREKNAFPTLFADDPHWLMLFYDADSSLGTDNKGNLAFDYYLEDIDYTEAGDPIFNGQGSVLWVNLREAFYDKIATEYTRLRTEVRNDGSGNALLSYNVVDSMFDDHQGKWSEAIFNEDGYRKSIEPYVLNGDGLYLPMLQGKKEQQRKWWLYNRFRYKDSQFVTGSSMETRITIRAHAKANMTLTSYANMYGHVYYNAEKVEHRMTRGQPQEFVWAATGAEDAVIGVNDADLLVSLGDLSPLMVELIDISKATHLTELKVGDASASYENKSLNSITLGNNILLKTLDLRNCTSLSQAVDASGCTNIEEIYLDGTAVTGISVPNGGMLKTLHLPATVSNLTIQNQPKLTEFSMPNYSAVTTLRLENAGCVNPLDILPHIAPGSRVRVLDINAEADSGTEVITFLELLNSMRGLDENGNNVDNALVSGYIHVAAVVANQAEIIEAARNTYPNLTIEYDEVRNPNVYFYNGDTLLQTVENVPVGGSASYTGATPTKPDADVPEDWRFVGWSPEPVNVTGDMKCYAQFAYANVNSVKLIEGTISGEYENNLATSIGDGALAGCTKLTKFTSLSATYIGIGAFSYCYELDKVVCPAATGIASGAFSSCTKLTWVDVYFSWRNFVFSDNSKLETFIIRNTNFMALNATNFFNASSPIATGTGYIYVYSNLIDTYKSATNWSVYANQFRAIEDYPEITGG